MSEQLPVTTYSRIPTMGMDAIEKVRELETEARKLPQLVFVTEHLIHGKVYLRTIHLPAGSLVTGALIKNVTSLIVYGEAMVYVDDGPKHIYGYNVLPCSAGRKVAVFAITDIHMTMLFPTEATDVAVCETEFTDEVNLLTPLTDTKCHKIVITGE